MPKYDRLDNLRIATPCDKDWSTMTGDDQTRYCEHCDKCVHDLASMSKRDAAQLLRREERPCVRVTRDTQGRMVFKAVGFGALWAAAMAWMTLVSRQTPPEGPSGQRPLFDFPHAQPMTGDVASPNVTTGKLAPTKD